MNIKVQDIKAILGHVLDYVAEFQCKEFAPKSDYYWQMSAEDRTNLDRQPTDFSMGQTSEEWPELLAILEGRYPPSSQDILWLSEILRILGERDYMKLR
jgi:hypothetical protein